MATPLRREQAPAIDPDVVIPRAVREAAARADTALGTSVPVPEAAPPSPSSGNPTPTAGSEPPPATAAQSSQEQAPPSQDPVRPEDWERRYKTDFGRLDADRKRQTASIQEMSTRIDQLQRELAARQAPPEKRAPPRLNITEDEFNDYGPDFISMIQRIAQHTVQGQIEPLAQEVGRTKQQVGIHQNMSMHEQMTALFPQWADLNRYQPFIEWVMLPDPYSGAIRQRLMQEAWDAGDARRVNAFFQGFLAEEAALDPTRAGRLNGGGAPAAPNGAPVASPPLTLQQLAAPGGARSAQPMPAEKPVYTTEDITRFYTEVAAGKWRHRDADRAAVDRDIHQAQHEGRIILNQRRFTPPAPPNGQTR